MLFETKSESLAIEDYGWQTLLLVDYISTVVTLGHHDLHFKSFVLFPHIFYA
jgi:hypothetical protein